MTHTVITGNSMQDGDVVWRDASGVWTPEIADAAVYATEQSLADALDAARREEAAGQIIGVYEVAIDTVGARPVPLRLRERIRAGGPTIAVA
jgi:hypothetical protein